MASELEGQIGIVLRQQDSKQTQVPQSGDNCLWEFQNPEISGGALRVEGSSEIWGIMAGSLLLSGIKTS